LFKNIVKKIIKKITRWSGILVMTGFLVLSGFGCKGMSAAEKAAARPIVIEYWTMYEDTGALNAILNKYRKARPYLSIYVRQLRPDEFYNRFVEALADDKSPDILSINSRMLGKYVNRLQPILSSVKDTTVLVETNSFNNEKITINTIPRTLIDLNKLKTEYVQTVAEDVVRNGKIYGLPISLDVMALYYNKDLLDRAGIAEPPKTWEEFLADVKLLTKFDKTTGKIIQAGAALGTGANIPNSSDILYILFTQSNIPFVSKDGLAVFQRPPSNLQQGQQSPNSRIVDFYTDFANPNRDTYTWNDSMPNAVESFVNGQLAFFFGYNYQYAIIKSRAPQLNFEVVPMLQLSEEKKVNTVNYSVLTVPAKSKHANEAWALIDYLTRSSATKQYLDTTGRPTAIRSYVAEQAKKPELASFASQILIAESWYRGKDYEAADKAIQAIFAEWLIPKKEEELLGKQQNILNNAAAIVNQTL
jgi:multiple sugar transport system substrate-binding protein